MRDQKLVLTHVVLHRLRMPLVSPFRTSFGVETDRNALLIEVVGPDVHGWGECVADAEPLYSAEFSEGAEEVLKRFLIPRLDPNNVVAEDLDALMAPIRGNPMAKGGLEAAVLDAQCRLVGVSLSARFGAVRDRVPSGVSVGIHDSIGALIETVEGYVSQGYVRVKLKIEPGADVAQVRAVRERFPDLALQVDANCAYTLGDVEILRQLDPFNLLLIEQPLAEEDLRGHAQLAQQISTPVCLDESIVSLRGAREAIELGACSIVNIKPGRVGGYLQAKKIHDFCVASQVPVWCGGMLETGIGRAANLALAALPGFSLPGDISASARYFHRDITDAFVIVDGHMSVPLGAGIGVDPHRDLLREFTVAQTTIDLRK